MEPLGGAHRVRGLLAQAELLDQRAVALEVRALHVVQKAAAATTSIKQATAGVVVLALLAQVLGQVVDALGEQRDLDLGAAGVAALRRRTWPRSLACALW